MFDSGDSSALYRKNVLFIRCILRFFFFFLLILHVKYLAFTQLWRFAFSFRVRRSIGVSWQVIVGYPHLFPTKARNPDEETNTFQHNFQYFNIASSVALGHLRAIGPRAHFGNLSKTSLDFLYKTTSGGSEGTNDLTSASVEFHFSITAEENFFGRPSWLSSLFTAEVFGNLNLTWTRRAKRVLTLETETQ